ncbi:hypothetical protein AGDE_15515 [Angomonas deanei]|uniref:WD domain, G-beta repeat n=1 Tax=Angomonas deanei TaxID=59799 RepID=A0A7G2C4X5_9TRYP|nr:hypothetical protein AGDE_15515 [Angomonas deanei]CAD2214261.1 hypothetical protein, conserved [Angomonas deanei]|eukprot:EPY18937.1 hypothetical protein AGDE_15515 [Angomonas deanei]
MRLACCVRPLPTLNDVKSLLRGQTTSKVTQIYDSLDGGCVDARGSKRLCREDSSNSCCSSNENPVDGYYTFKHSCILNPSLWMVEGDASENTIFVVDAVSGRRLLRIRDPKMNVPVTAMMHAPFRGYMNRNVQVIPIRHQEDILRLKQSKLIETDYVWVGLSDGSIRLFLANCNKVRESDRSAQMSRGELADLVFELPKYHTSSIVSIARSPCHRDEEGFNQTTAQRPSSAVEYATAASRVSQNEREHLSLMCSASVDSSIVIWDVRTIYIAIEKLRQERKLEMERGSYRPSFATADVVTIEGFHPSYTVRSGCVLVKVRPVMKLKGGIVGLRTLNWISTVVTTEGYQPRRDAGLMTRDAEEMGAPDVVKERPMKQIMTRFERREEHRRTLGISEWEMQEIEEELRTLLPPLAKEPAQSIRINLLVAGDGSGVIHVWNLDEELKSRPISHGESLSPSRSPARSISPEKSAWSASSPSVRLSGSGPGVAPVKGLKKNSKKERGSSSTPSRKSVGRASMGRSSNRLSSETPNRSSTKGSRTEGKSFPLSSAKAKREGSQGVSKSSASPSATAGPVRKTPKKVPLLSKASSGGQAKSGAVRKTADPGPRKTVVLTTDVSPQPVPRAKSNDPFQVTRPGLHGETQV